MPSWQALSDLDSQAELSRCFPVFLKPLEARFPDPMHPTLDRKMRAFTYNTAHEVNAFPQ
jgi:hypothetical protein